MAYFGIFDQNIIKIVKPKAKCPMLKGWAYNKIQWSTHPPPKLNSLTNDTRMTKVDIRMIHRE